MDTTVPKMPKRSIELDQAIGHVRAFHDAFGIENATELTAEIGDRQAILRYKLMREENEEYLNAA